ncbi:MAG: DEAD/DEAH box helicase, partial [FCB group bacterium]|nr:DEAD/DEAH box helicase [FCB group bacterium]
LESMFPYTETSDQLSAIRDINRDMEAPRIMDRLVCGDVGFGKTEVAIRAAFKAVYSGKQVAVLVPTTTLSFQHYENFHDRLDPFGIKVEYLNRFVTGATLARRLAAVKNGQIDVLVGTHKILSNSLLFSDLGLLIIDEEHRFGVNHKDKIRALKRQLDVITLTATPIPRTLQLSLAGLRDVSKIDTPPKERLPIATKVVYWNENEIRGAIERELERGGQIFILNNRIGELAGLREKISDMFPGNETRFAHGKMSGPELEKTLLDFYHHRFDILISTTIIESGIDIPNANTLIVLNAHTFGLSQLYQIRGRVGRSYKKAFAYLVIPRGVHISPAAMRRLQTLEYYTDLGSGYQIAMRDLEIRGAGDLFGVEQSGHINRVGYAYFNRLFSEEVTALKEDRDSYPLRPDVPDIRLEHAAYLPDNYIDNKDIRISFYRSLSDILSEANEPRAAFNAIKRLGRACRDRFGHLPQEAVNLFNDAHLALWLKPFYVDTLSLINGSLGLSFSRTVPVTVLQRGAGRLLAILNAHYVPINFTAKQYLSAEMDIKFLELFYSGTFGHFPDSMPDN